MKTLVAGFFAAVTAVAFPAVATAAPDGWNIKTFIDCTNQLARPFLVGDLNPQQLDQAYAKCCDVSGGAWAPRPGQPGNQCVSRPA
jgi:hypothetical protein